MDNKEKAKEVVKRLKEIYPDAKCALNFSSPFELLIATILSAQCTDARVNMVTPGLFAKFPTPVDFAEAPLEEIEKAIFSTGFYRQKAKSIKNCCKILAEKYNSEVPSDFDILKELPGVGRKTASVVVGNAFGQPAIAVDTHVKRISNLLGLVDSQDPDKIEAQLKNLLDREDWVIYSHLIAIHGRTVCFARNPECFRCVLADLCPGRRIFN
ncbi:MAG: endonuclease III [Ignavibacteriales bacterium]|nr:MAG: endonuclease III [Ignavibacteriaceae bacterium]MBW7872137.1 endonuclease III [Ignavibacteria bacterium]MCZ2142279.1 endonuclease III [Ignavibacteriales bacterium]OQY76660.1 MAG: endonuclease III [Ignavibacteriales bacterium UTCHB3]MBV6445718.1 Endonuclease III [Ignavibacteriaceae bacterium]